MNYPAPVRQKRRTPAQIQAFADYQYAQRQLDRYTGSVFVTAPGQRDYENKVTAAYQACKALGMGIEHGL